MNVWGEDSHPTAACSEGGGAQGNVITVALYKPSGEQLQWASPCLHLKDRQRRLMSDWTCKSHACGCRGLPLLFTLSLMGVHTSRSSSSRPSEFWLTQCDALHSALCAAALNALANASACNGGCQHHLDSIDQAPTWGQTIRSMSLTINPNDRLELGLLQRKDHAWSLWHCVSNMLANFKKLGSAIVSHGC